jgi:hypothetical protein
MQERLRMHIKKQMDEMNETTKQQAMHCSSSSSLVAEENTTTKQCGEYKVFLYNFVDENSLEDLSDVEETVSDIAELLSPLGTIRTIRILSSNQSVQGGASTSACAEITFCEENNATLAVQSINGMVCGGKPILATRVLTTDYLQPTSAPQSDDGQFQSASYGETFTSSTILQIENLVFADDDMQEVVCDVREICGGFGPIGRVWIERRLKSTTTTIQGDKTHFLPMHALSDIGPLPWAVIEYSDVEDAALAVTRLNGRVVAGEKLSARLVCPCDHLTSESSVLREETASVVLVDTGNENHSLNVQEACSLFAVRLTRFATMEEILDEDDKVEVIDNARSLIGAAFSAVGETAVLLGTATSIVAKKGAPKNNGEGSIFMLKRTPSGDDIDVLYSVRSVAIAAKIQQRLRGVVLAGAALQSDIVELSFPLLAANTNTDADVNAGASISVSSGHEATVRMRPLCLPNGKSMCIVQNYFTEDDLQGLVNGSTEDFVAVKKDLLELATGTGVGHAQSDGALSAGIAERVFALDGVLGSFGEQCSSPPDALAEEFLYVANVAFPSVSDAVDAMLGLDMQNIGGVFVQVRLKKAPGEECSLAPTGELDADKVEIIAEDGPRHGQVAVKRQEQSNGGGKDQGACKSNQGVSAEAIAGVVGDHVARCVFVRMFEVAGGSIATPTVVTVQNTADEEASKSNQDVSEIVENNESKGVSLYVGASLLPKLAPHDEPNRPISVSTLYYAFGVYSLKCSQTIS